MRETCGADPHSPPRPRARPDSHRVGAEQARAIAETSERVRGISGRSPPHLRIAEIAGGWIVQPRSRYRARSSQAPRVPRLVGSGGLARASRLDRVRKELSRYPPSNEWNRPPQNAR